MENKGKKIVSLIVKGLFAFVMLSFVVGASKDMGINESDSLAIFIMLVLTVFEWKKIVIPIREMSKNKKSRLIYVILLILKIWLVITLYNRIGVLAIILEIYILYFLIHFINKKKDEDILKNKNLEDDNFEINEDLVTGQGSDDILKLLVKEEFKKSNIDISNFKISGTKKNQRIFILCLIIYTLITFSASIYINSINLFLIFLLLGIYGVQFFKRKLEPINMIVNRIKKKPDEDISLIIKEEMPKKETVTLDLKYKIILVFLGVSLLVFITFFNPRVKYEKIYDGYKIVRFHEGIRNYGKKVEVNGEYKGEKVVAIGEGSFKNGKFSEIVLPDSVESIQKEAFYGNIYLKKAVMPKELKEIREGVFKECINLEEVILNENLKEIRGRVFSRCLKLLKIDLPKSLEYLGGNVFSFSGLKEIEIPEKIVNIEGNTFADCKNLKEVKFHDNIRNIRGGAFMNSGIEEITLPENITEIRGDTFRNCKELAEITIPKNVVRIGGHAFFGCSSLEKVIFPENLKEIGSSAFRQCSSLKEVEIPLETNVNIRAFKESPTKVNKVTKEKLNGS